MLVSPWTIFMDWFVFLGDVFLASLFAIASFNYMITGVEEMEETNCRQGTLSCVIVGFGFSPHKLQPDLLLR